MVTYPKTTAPVTLANFPKFKQINFYVLTFTKTDKKRQFKKNAIEEGQICVIAYLKFSTESLSLLQMAQMCSASGSGSNVELQQTFSACMSRRMTGLSSSDQTKEYNHFNLCIC